MRGIREEYRRERAEEKRDEERKKEKGKRKGRGTQQASYTHVNKRETRAASLAPFGTT